jgi:putative ABC transport system permease protein
MASGGSMQDRIGVAWLQLSRDKLRLAVGVAGVAFAVILVFMQLGFRTAVYESATRYHRALDFDLVLVSPKTPFVGVPRSFSRRRLFQVLGFRGVAAVSPLYIYQANWKNPWTYAVRNIVAVGVDPARRSFLLPEVVARLSVLQRDDAILFDALSRPEYGPVAERVRDAQSVSVEVNDRRFEIGGLFELGTSFGIDGTLITSDLNYRRMFPERRASHIDLGLIQLEPGADPQALRDVLDAALEDDVLVLTRAQWMDREVRYWSSTTPTGFVFGFGAIMGLIVGAVIVYQILFADVSQHLREYATLKALGYSNRFLSGVVLQEAAWLAGLGYLPGIAVTVVLYGITADATRLPLELTLARTLGVLALTLGMCGCAALIALRKVRSADPAEVFG